MTPDPLWIEISRSELLPPITTATSALFPLVIFSVHGLVDKNTDEMYFQLQLYAEFIRYRAPNACEKRSDVFSGRLADIVDEVGMQRRNFRPAFTPPLSACRFD